MVFRLIAVTKAYPCLGKQGTLFSWKGSLENFPFRTAPNMTNYITEILDKVPFNINITVKYYFYLANFIYVFKIYGI